MRVRLIADAGMVYTNGNIYGTDIALAEGHTAEGFYQIPRAEYERILAEQEAAAVRESMIAEYAHTAGL